MNAKSFPPASDLLALIGRIDWIKVSNVTLEGVDYFLEIVEQFCMFTVALATVLYSKWQENQVTTKLINAAQVSYTWMIQVALPYVITTGLWLLTVAYPQARKMALKGYAVALETYQALTDIYQLITARQFTTL